MEICGKYFFENKAQFERVKGYLERNGKVPMCVTDEDVTLDDYNGLYYIETYTPQTLEEIIEIHNLCKED